MTLMFLGFKWPMIPMLLFMALYFGLIVGIIGKFLRGVRRGLLDENDPLTKLTNH